MNLDNLVKDVRSWKTTLVGWLTGLTLILPQVIYFLDSNPDTVADVKLILAGLAALGFGTFAKDGDKSSEDVSDGN